jgi:hypothetical protein
LTGGISGIDFTAMVGAFGLLDDGNPYHFPPDHLIEAKLRADIWALMRCGGLTEGTTTELQYGPVSYPLARRSPDIWIG